MPDRPKLMVFTDLDGTLLDHHTYRWDAASDALQLLRDNQCAVILASSKTASEISPLRAALGFSHWPAIVENGAGLLQEGEKNTPDDTQYQRIRQALETAPQDLRKHFRGFGDLTAPDIATLTGLAPEDAAAAKQRCFSEPGQWSGSEDHKTRFLAHLAGYKITAQQGGRFLTLSHGGNKADRVKELIATHRPAHTVALGDAPNDRAMIEAADVGVVVANPDGQKMGRLAGEDTGRILRTGWPGPRGWNAAMLTLLEDLGIGEG
ncbi:MAG: HAD-IIB family hydrolase [Pseudomonadota bacterium]